MTIIYLVRHAQCVGNVEKRLTGWHDYDLTKEGENQAKSLAKHLKNIKFDTIYASPFKRTINTVKIIADKNNLKINTCKNLSEMNFGSYDGYTWEEVDKIDSTIMHNSKKEIMGIPEQETTKHVQDRMMKTMQKIAEENKGKIILVCSHGISIEAFLRRIDNIPFNKESKKYSQGNTSINIVEYCDGKFSIKGLNENKHLQMIKT